MGEKRYNKEYTIINVKFQERGFIYYDICDVRCLAGWQPPCLVLTLSDGVEAIEIEYDVYHEEEFKKFSGYDWVGTENGAKELWYRLVGKKVDYRR